MGSSLKELRGNADGVSREEPDKKFLYNMKIQYFYIKILISKIKKIFQTEALGILQ